jgi:hypothetical protein
MLMAPATATIPRDSKQQPQDLATNKTRRSRQHSQKTVPNHNTRMFSLIAFDAHSSSAGVCRPGVDVLVIGVISNMRVPRSALLVALKEEWISGFL